MSFIYNFIQYHLFWFIVIISAVITLVVTLAYKVLTNQEEMKKLKEEIKALQKELKAHRGNQKEMMKIQRRMLAKNMEYSKHSFKVTFYTLIPLLIVFAWLNNAVSYVPLQPGQKFNINVIIDDSMPGSTLRLNSSCLNLNKNLINISSNYVIVKSLFGSSKQVIINASVKQSFKKGECKLVINNYVIPIKVNELPIYRVINIKKSGIKSVVIGYNKSRPLGNFKIFGMYPSWIVLYIITSLIFSSIFRKLLKVY